MISYNHIPVTEVRKSLLKRLARRAARREEARVSVAKAAHAPRGGKWTKWRCLPRRMAHGPKLSTDFAVLLSKQHAWSDLKQVPAQDVAAHMERIDKLLTEYVQATLMGDTAWYKQPCVSSDYACPARIGNFMHHYLNALAFATTRNVPFAWSQSWKYQVEPCDTYIKRSSWLNNVRLHSTTDRCAKRSTCRLGDALAEVSNSSFEQRLACVGTRQLRRCDTENDLIVLSSKGAERFDSMELVGAGCTGGRVQREIPAWNFACSCSFCSWTALPLRSTVHTLLRV